MASFVFAQAQRNANSWWMLLGYLDLLEAVGVDWEPLVSFVAHPAPGECDHVREVIENMAGRVEAVVCTRCGKQWVMA